MSTGLGLVGVGVMALFLLREYRMYRKFKRATHRLGQMGKPR